MQKSDLMRLALHKAHIEDEFGMIWEFTGRIGKRKNSIVYEIKRYTRGVWVEENDLLTNFAEIE